MEPQNKKTNTVESVEAPNVIQDFAPDKVQQKTSADGASKPPLPGFQQTGSGLSPVGTINSLNFTSNASGWAFGSSGDAQFNGNHVVSGHFVPVVTFLGKTLWVSDGTDPTGTLSGATGDILIGGDLGKLYVCVGGTTWYAPA